MIIISYIPYQWNITQHMYYFTGAPLDATSMVDVGNYLAMQQYPFGSQVEAYAHGVNKIFQALLFYKIYCWLQQSYGDIKVAFCSKGGWEGWQQVELTLWLIKAGFEVEREVPLFKTGRLAVDMVVTHPALE